MFFCISGSAQSKSKIKIAPESRVENEIITLNDIANITESERSGLLQSITLGYSPNIGMTREILREQIVLSIAAAGIRANEYLLDSPQKVLITRGAQQVGGSFVREAVEKAISDHFSATQIDARLIRLDLPETFAVPVGAVEIRTRMANVSNPFAPFSLPIEIRVSDKTFKRISANVEIEAYADILVVDQNQPVGKQLSDGDVRVESRRLERPFGNYLNDPENLRGASLVKPLAGGTAITRDSFVYAVVVKSGDLVKIIGQSGKMQISVNGEAQSNGKIGDRISVRNSESKSIIQATVVDEGLVKIFF